MPDAVIIGSGPNGLAAAIVLAQAGLSVLVYEAEASIGGGARSAELTLPGFVHDICSAVHPLAISSPFFRSLPLAEHGLEWIQPPAALAHPFDDGTAVVIQRSVEATSAMLDSDAVSYCQLLSPFVAQWEPLVSTLLAPLQLPEYPLLLAIFGWRGLRSAQNLADSWFTGERARALFAGWAAHSMLPLDRWGTAAFGLVLGISGHAAGWPFPRGGAQKITNSLAAYLRTLGGEIVTSTRVASIDELPSTRAILCDVTPRQLLQIAGNHLPPSYRRKLERYRYGSAAFKVDWALDGPIPWIAEECQLAATVHLGGTMQEIVQAENAPWRGEHTPQPFVLLTQPSLFDSTRVPAGKHTVWAYCHVANGSDVDMTEQIENQIERFAPGFRDCVLARSIMAPATLERHNANLIGGDINGGAQDLRQLFLRPTFHWYTTPAEKIYLCSSSTPPGGGVHGMCGYFAARTVLSKLLR